MRSVLLAGLAATAFGDADVGFEDWFTSEYAEVLDKILTVNGTIPDYIHGRYGQSGPGQFEMGEMKFTHALDGFAKSYILTIEGGRISFSSTFLQSQFYQKSVAAGHVAASMTAAETDPPSRAKLGPLNAMGPNDNNYIKPIDFDGHDFMTCDTMYLTVMKNNFANISETITPVLPGSMDNPHWEDDLTPPAHMCIQATMAHSWHEDDGSLVATMGCQTLNVPGVPQYYKLFTLEPGNIRKRKLIKKIELPIGRVPSYMHQNAETEDNFVILGVPLYMDMMNVVAGKGLAEGGLISPLKDDTLFHVVNKKTHKAHKATGPGILMGHVLGSYEDGSDIIVDISSYTVESGGFFPRYLLKNLQPGVRDSWPKGDLTRITIHADGTTEYKGLLPDEPKADIELPVINPNYHTKKYCVVWGVQFSHGGRSFASTALIKRNVCTGEAKSRYVEGQYVSEHRFIPRPHATEEDDGTLLGMVFDGVSKQTFFEFVDAQTLETLATVPLEMKAPFPIHTTWFPSVVDPVTV